MEAKLYYNAKVYTSDPSVQNATAFAIVGERFVFVGSDEEGLAKYGTGTDLHGKRVVPGFFESHAHLIDTAINSTSDVFFIDPTIPREDVLSELKKILYSEPIITHPLVKGMGMKTSDLITFTRFDLDAIDDKRAVFIFSDDGHAMIINTKAMNLIGITKDTKDPSESSYLVRDAEGVPTGVLVEIAAMSLCMKYLSSTFDPDRIRQAIKDTILGYSMIGYVAGFDAATFKDESDDAIALLTEMADFGELNMDIFLSFVYDPLVPAEEAVSRMAYYNKFYASPYIHPTSFKFISDGTIEDQAALLYEPYIDEKSCDNCGHGLSAEEMLNYAKVIADAGYNIHIHAIGDKAIANSIEALSSLKGMHGTRTIAHNQLYNEETKKAMIADGGIFYNTTPYWTVADDYTLKVLGKERFENQFPTGTMVRNGVKVTFGSDSLDGEKCVNPFWGIYYSVKRGEEGSGLIPPESEKITVAEAVDAYTINGAMQFGMEHEMGSITKGKLADFAVLTADIFDIPTDEIPKTKVERLIYHGREVFSRK